MSIKPLFIMIHGINIVLALATSIVQTRRIMDTIRRFNTPALCVLGGGLLAAIFGTFGILHKFKPITKDINELKQYIYNKKGDPL